MVRRLTVFFFLCICALAMGQRTPSIVGTWVADKTQQPGLEGLKNFEATFGKDGSFRFTGMNVDGTGTYKLEKGKLTIVLSKRGGSTPTNPKEKQGEGKVIENGKAILLSTGMTRDNVPVMLRIVRKK
jgi:hypothetical protein